MNSVPKIGSAAQENYIYTAHAYTDRVNIMNISQNVYTYSTLIPKTYISYLKFKCMVNMVIARGHLAFPNLSIPDLYV